MTTLLAVGCYTHDSRAGVHLLAGDDVDLAPLARFEAEHASFLTVADATLYAVRETTANGSLVALRLADGALHQIDEVPSHGAAPCHVSTDGHHVHVANYGSGTTASYALLPDGGFGQCVGRHRHEGSGPHVRQEAPHAHSMVPGPDGRWVYACDLGTDRIVRYRFAADVGEFVRDGETVMPPGSGPRHLTFHPTWPVAYALCELDCTLVVLDVDVDGGDLRPRVAVPTVPPGTATGSLAAEVSVHPTGHRVYVSNRGHDSLATFAHETPAEAPRLLAHVASGGRTPRHFAIHPNGQLLFAANQDSGTVVAFALDDDLGVPERVGVAAEMSQPVCVAFVEEAP